MRVDLFGKFNQFKKHKKYFEFKVRTFNLKAKNTFSNYKFNL